MLTDTLEPNKPLKIVHVTPVGAESGTSISRRPHQQLTETVRETHDAFRVAFATRFLPRYGKNLVNRSHVFDRTMFLCPGSRRLKYVDLLLASTAAVDVALAYASEIKTKIRAEVHSLLTDAVKEKRVRDKKAAEAATAIVNTPAAKQARTTAGGGSATQGGGSATEGVALLRRGVALPRRGVALLRRGGALLRGGGGSVSSHHTTETLHGAGFWDDSDDDQEPLPHVDRDAKEEANSLLNDWMVMKVIEQGSSVRFRSCRRPNSCLLATRRSAVADFISGICKSDRCVAIVYTGPSTFDSVGLLFFLIHV